MCRNIKTLHNFKPPATDEEIHASSLQFVRKLSGFTRPSKANQIAFSRAVDQVAKAAHELLDSLVTNAPPRDREVEASRARALGGRSLPRLRRETRHLADNTHKVTIRGHEVSAALNPQFIECPCAHRRRSVGTPASSR
jgi:hypothetical protein